ncbi:GNAT family N-acetyltransferase [Aquabacterium sp.]|uniref:GNAT family N-acetyltransferase n=1 Tax=Aquabacterium sp. TaxID=1872578 RepID=UPI002CDA2217|nr:GNAT family protein [Aquabacterium sp.]HSW04471.1 GNAT family protein [Aquabacterium sp.]
MDRHDLIAAPRELLTPRLRLESPREAHAPAFVDSLLRTLPALRFVGWGQLERDLAWALQFCQRGAALFDSGECVIYNAFHHGTGRYVGRIDLHTFDFEAPRCEVGYVGDEAHAGQGLMREAVLAVMDLGFSLGLARIHALSDARNARALAFAQALGMQREGLLQAYERDPQGGLCDMVMFAAISPQALQARSVPA